MNATPTQGRPVRKRKSPEKFPGMVASANDEAIEKIVYNRDIRYPPFRVVDLLRAMNIPDNLHQSRWESFTKWQEAQPLLKAADESPNPRFKTAVITKGKRCDTGRYVNQVIASALFRRYLPELVAAFDRAFAAGDQKQVRFNLDQEPAGAAAAAENNKPQEIKELKAVAVAEKPIQQQQQQQPASNPDDSKIKVVDSASSQVQQAPLREIHENEPPLKKQRTAEGATTVTIETTMTTTSALVPPSTAPSAAVLELQDQLKQYELRAKLAEMKMQSLMAESKFEEAKTELTHKERERFVANYFSLQKTSLSAHLDLWKTAEDARKTYGDDVNRVLEAVTSKPLSALSPVVLAAPAALGKTTATTPNDQPTGTASSPAKKVAPPASATPQPIQMSPGILPPLDSILPSSSSSSSSLSALSSAAASVIPAIVRDPLLVLHQQTAAGFMLQAPKSAPANNTPPHVQAALNYRR